jgi:hypothetical protein
VGFLTKGEVKMDNYELVEYTGSDRPEYILKNGRALNIYGAKKILEDQQREITELKSQHNESCTKWRDQFESMHQRAMKAERENAELKSSLQSVKADAVKDFMKHIQYSDDDGLIDEEYINESFDFWLENSKGKT